MTRLLLASTLAGVLLAGAIAWSFRAEVARAAEPPPAARDAAAEQLEAVARACISGGAEVSYGTDAGVYLLRCRPAPLNLGVMPAARRR